MYNVCMYLCMYVPMYVCMYVIWLWLQVGRERHLRHAEPDQEVARGSAQPDGRMTCKKYPPATCVVQTDFKPCLHRQRNINAPCHTTRVARWHIFTPKILIWVNFGGSCNRRCTYILWPFGLFYGHLVCFVAIWYTFWPFGICCGYLVYFSV
jgi:hypothetical protein